MECKATKRVKQWITHLRINRNIVECKDVRCRRCGRIFSARINRNIVECKAIHDVYFTLQLFVLIETLWNVKCAVFCNPRDSVRVLIETLWNVKCNDWGSWVYASDVLIETLWNVKLSAILESSSSILY